MWPLTRRARVEKARHEVRIGPRTASVDVFAGPLAGLALVSVALDDDAFTAPDWSGAEVSGDPHFADARLARDGLPVGHRSILTDPTDERPAMPDTATRSGELFASEEAAEGMAAFREKRPARWVPGASSSS